MLGGSGKDFTVASLRSAAQAVICYQRSEGQGGMEQGSGSVGAGKGRGVKASC